MLARKNTRMLGSSHLAWNELHCCCIFKSSSRFRDIGQHQTRRCRPSTTYRPSGDSFAEVVNLAIVLMKMVPYLLITMGRCGVIG